MGNANRKLMKFVDDDEGGIGQNDTKGAKKRENVYRKLMNQKLKMCMCQSMNMLMKSKRMGLLTRISS